MTISMKGGFQVEDILMQLIQSQGIWAVLFVFLLLYTIKKNDKLDEIQDSREKKYQEVISELTDQLSIVNIINKKLDSICSSQTKNSEKARPPSRRLAFSYEHYLSNIFFFIRLMYCRLYPNLFPISPSLYPDKIKPMIVRSSLFLPLREFFKSIL